MNISRITQSSRRTCITRRELYNNVEQERMNSYTTNNAEQYVDNNVYIYVEHIGHMGNQDRKLIGPYRLNYESARTHINNNGSTNNTT